MTKIATKAAGFVLALIIGAGTAPLPAGAGEKMAAERNIGDFERIFAFDGAMPTGVTVAPDGRVFVNFPRWGDEVPFTVGEIRGRTVVPYPNLDDNRGDAAHAATTLVSVQSVVADKFGHLWILDTGAPRMGTPIPGGPKLIEVSLRTNSVLRRIPLGPDVVLPTSYANDVRLDFAHGRDGYAYITDSAARGPAALIVVDLSTGQAWRRLSGHPSVEPQPGFVPIVEGEALMHRPKDGAATPFAVGADGIALSPDGETLYYCPLSSRHLFSVPAALLRDRSVADDKVAAGVRDLGEKGASDGLDVDSLGRVYAGDYEHDSIRRYADGQWTTIAHNPHILWPDTLSVRGNHLFFTANQLERQPGFHGGEDQRTKPYALFRMTLNMGDRNKSKSEPPRRDN